ncbi:MAG TPA: hypothetical protein VHK01_04905 [Lacipirellulaceae bacterium]|nr:hypothetical protein [Lacipirellulaceae bacterium]
MCTTTMRCSLLVIAAVFVSTVCGCTTIAEPIFDSVIDSIDGDDDEIDPRILKRKGIEPGSERHKRMIREDQFYKDFQRNFGRIIVPQD